MDKNIEKIALDIQNNKVSREELVKLSQHDNAFIRSLVASHPQTPLNIIKKLSYDKDILVISSALDNPKYPKDELKKRMKEGLGKHFNDNSKGFQTNLDDVLKD